MITVIQILRVLLDVVWWIVVVQIVLSILIAFNVINTHSPFIRSLYDGLERLTEPMYRPIRRVLPATGGMDFAPAVVLILIVILNIILGNLENTIVAGTPM